MTYKHIELHANASLFVDYEFLHPIDFSILSKMIIINDDNKRFYRK